MPEHELYLRWKNSFRSPKTRDNLLNLFEGYRAWRGVSIDELLTERTKTYYPDRNLPVDQQAIVKRTVEEKVKDYLLQLEREGYSPNTVVQNLKAIKSFYNVTSYETMPLGITRRGLRMGKHKVIESLPPTAEEINEVLKFGTLRVRAMIAFIAETGWAPELMATTKVGEIMRDDGIPYVIITRRGKTGEQVVTFIGERAAGLVDAYLMARFGKDFASHASELLFVNNHGMPLKPRRINEAIVRVAIKARLNKKLYKGRNSFHAYALRHFFQTTLEDAKVSQNWVKAMMGHSLGEVEGAYSKPRVMQMRETYKEAYPKLIGETKPIVPNAPEFDSATVMRILQALEQVAKSTGIKLNVEEILNGKEDKTKPS